MTAGLRRAACAAVSCVLLALPPSVGAQARSAPPMQVDRAGVMRWTATGEEVALFGVNYAAPFAFDYRAITARGIDPKRAIDQDVAHLARLGLDAFRIHVWDREVSDREGNLLANVHLDLLDYLLHRLAERGIKSILTPIAWWGSGYPEPDPVSPGFSNGYSKEALSVDTSARKAQARYVAQFVAHVNPYTRRSYRDDPDIIAFEVINEPFHAGTPEETTRYINTMVASMRGAGVTKPIFYNISERYFDAHGRAVCSANVQGVTAQWYPTGLVRGRTLPGNPLPNVNRYVLPWADFPECRGKARMVYEFDGADVALPVMYPAMARAFRGAGFQWATQFAYDPLAIAHTNTEYQTHYVNLVYTPAKAVSLLIAGEVFRRTARGTDAGEYPKSERFGPFRTSYQHGGSEVATDSLFAYSVSTNTAPPNPAALTRVAGVGKSRVVSYDGTGAYFLDRLADGVWRLEVYPDAVPVEDPFSRGGLDRTVTRLYWREHAMRLTMPNLGSDFSVTPLNAGNAHRPVVTDGRTTVRPGVYLLARAGTSGAGWTADRRIGYRTLGEFHAPSAMTGPPVARHEPPASVSAGDAVAIRSTVALDAPIDSAFAYVRWAGWRGFKPPVRLRVTDPYTVEGELPVGTDRTGVLEYAMTVHSAGTVRTFPEGNTTLPTAWDFGGETWSTRVVPSDAEVVLFDADRDRAWVVEPGYMQGVRSHSDWTAADSPEQLAWSVGVDAYGPQATHVAFRTMASPSVIHRTGTAGTGGTLLVRARAVGSADASVELALIQRDASAWGARLALTSEWREIAVPLETLRRLPLVLLPRPFPGFLPYDLMATSSATAADLRLFEGLQWGFPKPSGADRAVRVEIASVVLRPTPPK
ncbi:MAG: hypothetical protein SFW08_04740 [Gemmatimonadaceae bacterium]|nr:hypothetical protein [Gemmatimonadaceae bacterium]